MKVFHHIGESPSTDPRIAANYNNIDQILSTTGPISFDGVYESVWDNRDALKDRDVYLFITGNYVGKDNSFDTGMPLVRFLDWERLNQLENNYGFILGWHTWSHPDLTKLAEDEISREITAPYPMSYFAYPYGTFNETTKRLLKQAGYKKAWSTTQGNIDQYSLYRGYVR